MLPGGGPIYVPRDDGGMIKDDGYFVCAECNTHIFPGDEDLCPICRRRYCEDCFDDHDCGFLRAQAMADDL